ncbi:winged helix-turn-helix transcriptional regulator [Anaerotruncus colihominis]|uniref:winged helix-turn-helix transcriptional regulator n=1 Tax=Anaerotruncus colihominis TaxID=169435 RepID=UPI001897E9E4|nr:helix-turn-helix domain-containing protein [Anaerotruncus colihominis]
MYTLKEPISYEEFLRRSREGIVTESGNCPITPVLTLFQGKWKNQVIYELFCRGTMRFGELKKGLQGITNTMLTSALRDLEADGLVQRKQFNEIPPHVEYSLTEKGLDLQPVLYAMLNWGCKYERDFYGVSTAKLEE